MISPMLPRVTIASSFDRDEGIPSSAKQQAEKVEVQKASIAHPKQKRCSVLQSRDSIVSISSTLSSSSHHGISSSSSHHRRRSSVSFDGETKVIEFSKLNKGDRENVWYNKRELSEMKQQCRRLAQRSSECFIEWEAETQRGLEHLMISSSGQEQSSSSSTKRLSNRKHCQAIVFSEHANQILEYGFICDEERLALEYKLAAESSKRRALERGYLNAETAWGDEDASSSSTAPYQEAHC
jgi:hypothetical protein